MTNFSLPMLLALVFPPAEPWNLNSDHSNIDKLWSTAWYNQITLIQPSDTSPVLSHFFLVITHTEIYIYICNLQFFPTLVALPSRRAELRPRRGAGELLVLRTAALAAPGHPGAGPGGGQGPASPGALRGGKHPKRSGLSHQKGTEPWWYIDWILPICIYIYP